MLYIQVDVTLIDHPKTKKLARLLGVSRITAVGHLVALWSWAAQYATDGDLSDYREEPDVIADGAQWDADPAQFMNALINARIGTGYGFLEDHVDGSLLLHDWHEYFGRLIERRRQDAERKRQERRETSEDAQEDVRWTSTGRPQDTPQKSSVNVAQRNAAQLSEAQPNEESERGATFTPGPVIARASVTRTVGLKPNSKLSPAVNTFAQVTGKFPPRGIHHLIDAALEERNDPDLLQRCYETWLARGYRPENIAWLQEWYVSGAIPDKSGNRTNGHGAGHTRADTRDGYRVPEGYEDVVNTDVRTVAAPDPWRDLLAEADALAPMVRETPQVKERTLKQLARKLDGILAALPVPYDAALATLGERLA